MSIFRLYIAIYDTHEDEAPHCIGGLLYLDHQYCSDILFAVALTVKASHLERRRPAKSYGYSPSLRSR